MIHDCRRAANEPVRRHCTGRAGICEFLGICHAVIESEPGMHITAFVLLVNAGESACGLNRAVRFMLMTAMPAIDQKRVPLASPIRSTTVHRPIAAGQKARVNDRNAAQAVSRWSLPRCQHLVMNRQWRRSRMRQARRCRYADSRACFRSAQHASSAPTAARR